MPRLRIKRLPTDPGLYHCRWFPIVRRTDGIAIGSIYDTLPGDEITEAEASEVRRLLAPFYEIVEE